jgi:hypothetical protein
MRAALALAFLASWTGFVVALTRIASGGAC